MNEIDEIFDKYYSDESIISKNDMNTILHEIFDCDELFKFSYSLCKKYGQK